MLVLWAALNGRQPNTAQCAKGAEQKRCRLAAEDMRAIKEQYFWAYVHQLILVSSFNYLGQIPTALYNNWIAVVVNLWKANMKWSRISSILVQ